MSGLQYTHNDDSNYACNQVPGLAVSLYFVWFLMQLSLMCGIAYISPPLVLLMLPVDDYGLPVFAKASQRDGKLGHASVCTLGGLLTSFCC